MCKTDKGRGTLAEVGHGVLWRLQVFPESVMHPRTHLTTALGAHGSVGCGVCRRRPVLVLIRQSHQAVHNLLITKTGK